jgi:hypothetical protein
MMTGFVGKELNTAADLDMELIHGLRRQKGKISNKFIGEEYQDTAMISQKTPAARPKAIARVNAEKSSMRKLGMAATQKQTVAGLFRDATFGGSRSKSNFVSARK